ncbi:MAG: formate dehydrogenase accessory sulfurtransferase FdhD [Pseudomonadota bacterium]
MATEHLLQRIKDQKTGVQQVMVYTHTANSVESRRDALAMEEPLEITLNLVEKDQRVMRSISITMRTPGQDFELAAGFLYTEGIIHDTNDIRGIEYCGPAIDGLHNIVKVILHDEIDVDLQRLQRHFYTTSSCGICGKSSLDAVEVMGIEALNINAPKVSAALLANLPGILRKQQAVFDETGGLHAAALFSAEGELLDIREDVGRHNALDKLIGAQFLKGNLPGTDKLLLLSGRISFELVQKALVAGIPIIAAVSAPSSLALKLAQRFDMTLIGFLRGTRFNVYHGKQRIQE